MQHVAGENPRAQTTALAMSTTAFTVCFAVWTIFAIIGIEIRSELGLSETQFGLLVGTPILTGSLIRVILGIWAIAMAVGPSSRSQCWSRRLPPIF